MDADVKKTPHFDRLVLAGIGALSGLAGWLLIDVLPDRVENERAIMAIAALMWAFFGSLLVSIGPLPLRRAVLAGLAVSVVPALLFFWASFRFDDIESFLTSASPLCAFAILATVPLPFLIAGLSENSRWNDYPALFDNAWNIVVRYGVSWVFVGIFWGVVFLSDQLLKVVGLEIIEDLLDIDVVPYLLSGSALGLGLAVVHELRAYVSPYLVLRLLRLLLPVVLIVVAIFVVSVPVQGMSGLFGDLSAAGVLMAMAIGAVTLITTAIDQNNELAVAPGIMRKITRALGVLLPILAALSVYAIWARVNQHGWSPDRIAATIIAVFVLAYALIYALAVVGNANWMGRIRKANITMALALVGVAALWLTPAINPQRISTNSQMARFQDGKTAVANLPLWEIGREWGRAGKSALAVLENYEGPDAAALETSLLALDESSNKWNFKHDIVENSTEKTADLARLRGLFQIRPLGKDLPENFAPGVKLQSMLNGCETLTPAGKPACVGVFTDLLPARPGDELLVVWSNSGRQSIDVQVWTQDDADTWVRYRQPVALGDGNIYGLKPDVIDDLLNGDFTIQPANLNTLKVSDVELLLVPD